MTYDSSLRNYCKELLGCLAFLLACIVLIFGMLSSDTFSAFVLAGCVPSSPFLIWSIREWYREADAISANEPIISEIEELIKSYNSKSGINYKEKCRILQNSIFNRRSVSTLLLPGIYKFKRSSLEEDMKNGAKYWIDLAMYKK